MKKPLRGIDIFEGSELVDNYRIKTATLLGKEHWIVPVVMMVEGVHHGSQGALLYTAEELGKIVSSWDGIPVTVHHPQIEGEYTSANLPELAEGVVGRIFHARMEGNKLKAEAWVDINHLKEISEEAFDYIKEQRALEVSVGVFSERVNTPGEYNGVNYRSAAVNLRPDHLALLPGETGACSWEDGCGIRNVDNSKSNKKKMPGKKTEERFSKADHVGALAEQGFALHVITNEDVDANEAGFREIMQNVQSKLDRLDNASKMHFLEDLYDDYFIYGVRNRESGEMSFFKRTYSVNEDGSIELGDAPVKVRKDVNYIPTNSKLTRTKINQNKQVKMKRMNANAAPCTCTVDALIDNEATNFTEDDRTWLSDLSQEQLNKLAPKEESEEEPAANTSKAKKGAGTKTKKPMANAKAEEEEEEEEEDVVDNKKAALSIEDQVKAILSKETDPAKFIDNFMPDGLKGQMKSALKMHQEQRTRMIKEIVGNSKFKEDRLKKMEDVDLQDLYESLIGNRADYSLSAAGATRHEEDRDEENDLNEIGAMLSFEQPKKKVEEKQQAKK